MARVLQEFLHVDLAIAECRLGFALGGDDGIEQGGIGVYHAHAASAAAAGSLDDHRVADFPGNAMILVAVIAQRATGTAHAGPAGRLHGTDCFRSEEHTAEIQSLIRISYAVIILNKK